MNRRMGGYTLIELAIVVVVVSILAGVTLVGGDRFLNRTRDERQRANAATLSLKLERYYKYNSVSGIGHEYPSCADLIKNFSSIVGDDSLKKEMVRCDLIDSDDIKPGELFYGTSNIDDGDCTKPASGPVTDVVAATCTKYVIVYRERSTGIIKIVNSIWRD